MKSILNYPDICLDNGEHLNPPNIDQKQEYIKLMQSKKADKGLRLYSAIQLGKSGSVDDEVFRALKLQLTDEQTSHAALCGLAYLGITNPKAIEVLDHELKLRKTISRFCWDAFAELSKNSINFSGVLIDYAKNKKNSEDSRHTAVVFWGYKNPQNKEPI